MALTLGDGFSMMSVMRLLLDIFPSIGLKLAFKAALSNVSAVVISL